MGPAHQRASEGVWATDKWAPPVKWKRIQNTVLSSFKSVLEEKTFLPLDNAKVQNMLSPLECVFQRKAPLENQQGPGAKYFNSRKVPTLPPSYLFTHNSVFYDSNAHILH